MTLGVVCTNYNNARLTRGLVESLARDDAGMLPRVVVVDNRSTTNDVAALRQLAREHSFVDLLEMPSNLGYFPGLNVGILHLRRHRPDVSLMVVGNNDLEFPPGFHELVVSQSALLDEHAVIAPDLVDPRGHHQNPHVVSGIGRMRRLVWDIYFTSFAAAFAVRLSAAATRRFTVRAENRPTSTFHLSSGPIEQGYGACYLIGPAFFRHYEQLCAPTFLMQEEFFLTEQLRLIGELPFYDPRFKILHHHHATMGAVPRWRHWDLSRAAHRIYKHYLSLSKDAQRAFLIRHSTGPR